MDVDLYFVSAVAYGATILAALVAEFSPWQRVARPAAVTALVLAVVAGASWCTLVYQRGYIFSPGEQITASRRSGEAGTLTLWAHSSGSSDDKVIRMLGFNGGGEPGDDAGLDDDGSTGGGVKVAVLGDDATRAAGEDSFRETLLPARKRPFFDETKRDRDIDGEVKRDCFECPEMVIVAGGVALIGAPDTDPSATAAERPQRPVRIWPGFAISRQPISTEEFEPIRAEASLPLRTCLGPAPVPRRYAVCLTAADAEAYAAWLTRISGKRYRLPTATEWEFAARTKGTTVLAATATEGAPAVAAPLEGIGREMAEMTTDCFDPYIPSPGKERRAWDTNPLLCVERIIKGAAAGEAPYMQRPSVRRPWRHDEPMWRIGFRVVRDMS